MAHDIFISYATQDKSVAETICEWIEQAGFRCWIAPRDVPPGMEYAEGIICGIGEARLLVLIFSDHANRSTFVRAEVERAFSRRIGILTVRTAEVLPSKSLELFLSHKHWLDAFPPPLENHFERIVTSVGNRLGQSPRPLPAPPPSPQQPASNPRWRTAAIAGSLVVGALAAGWKSLQTVALPQTWRTALMAEPDRQFLKGVATDVSNQLGRVNEEIKSVNETVRKSRAFLFEYRASPKLPEPNELAQWLDHRVLQLEKLKVPPLWSPDWTAKLDSLGVPGNDVHAFYNAWLPQFWMQVRDFYVDTRRVATLPPVVWLKEQDRVLDLKADTLNAQAAAMYYGALHLFNDFPPDTVAEFHKQRTRYTQLPSVAALPKDEAQRQMETSLKRVEEAVHSLATLTGDESVSLQSMEKKLATVLSMDGQVASLDKELDAFKARLREKCTLLPDDKPGLMWGKILRLRTAGLNDDVQTSLDRYLALNLAREPAASAYVPSAKAYFADPVRAAEALGVLVIGTENGRPHSAVKIGDILLDYNGAKMARADDFLAAPRPENQPESRFVLLRLAADGSFERVTLIADRRHNPGLAVADLREVPGSQ